MGSRYGVERSGESSPSWAHRSERAPHDHGATDTIHPIRRWGRRPYVYKYHQCFLVRSDRFCNIIDVGISTTAFTVDVRCYDASTLSEARKDIWVPGFLAIAYAMNDTVKDDTTDGILALPRGM